MGRGDKKTKKGKRFAGSYGRVRIRKEKTEKYIVKPKDKEQEPIVKEKVKKKTAPKKKKTAKKTTTKK
tara:strand:- start:388 stop:591 length:204 start_codon:yes stop_codon:yes gene_type:complete